MHEKATAIAVFYGNITEALDILHRGGVHAGWSLAQSVCPMDILALFYTGTQPSYLLGRLNRWFAVKLGPKKGYI